MTSKLPMSDGDKMGKLTTLKSVWSACTRCPLSQLRKQVVFGKGNPDARLMFIGEAPGGDEDLMGEPFVGPAGEMFNRLLKAVGISRESIWVTNTCLCRPKIDKPGKSNRAPTSKEIEACLPRLVEEVNIIQPSVIVLGGNTPLYLATGKRGITKHRGWQQAQWTGDNFIISKIYATLHPASLLYGSREQRKQKAEWMHSDWLEIARVLSLTN